MVKNGKSEETADFKDFNQGRFSEISAKAKDYLSWYAPDGLPSCRKTPAVLNPACR